MAEKTEGWERRMEEEAPWETKEGTAQDVAVTNSSLYVTAGSLGVGMFTIDPLSGVLTKKAPEAVAVRGNPASIVAAL